MYLFTIHLLLVTTSHNTHYTQQPQPHTMSGTLTQKLQNLTLKQETLTQRLQRAAAAKQREIEEEKKRLEEERERKRKEELEEVTEKLFGSIFERFKESLDAVDKVANSGKTNYLFASSVVLWEMDKRSFTKDANGRYWCGVHCPSDWRFYDLFKRYMALSDFKTRNDPLMDFAKRYNGSPELQGMHVLVIDYPSSENGGWIPRTQQFYQGGLYLVWDQEDIAVSQKLYGSHAE